MNRWAKIGLWTAGFIAGGVLLSPLMQTVQNTISGLGNGGLLGGGNGE